MSEIKGIPVFAGKVKGIVCLATSSSDYKKINSGVVLVAKMTTPLIVPFLSQVVALVTDIGGLLSHAAIVARELKIPCVVGTKIATQVLKNGDLVEVDANNGAIRILNQKE